MAETSRFLRFVRVANVATKTLLRAGVKLTGFGAPMYLLTVRGRKSGQPRSTPISVLEIDGQRYLLAPYGPMDWVRNLRAAGEAILTRGRRAEAVHAMELPGAEASRVLTQFIATGNAMGRFFGVTRESSPEDFARAASNHPVFLLQKAAATNAGTANSTGPAR